MEKLKKFSITAGLFVGTLLLGYGVVRAALTLDATSVVSDGGVTLRGAAGSQIIIGNDAQTGTINIASSTGALILNLGVGNSAKTINIGTGTDIDTVNIGTGSTGVDVIRIGQAAADLALTDANWSITTAGVVSFATTSVTSFSVNGTSTLATSTFNGTLNVASGGVLQTGGTTRIDSAGAGTLVSLNLGSSTIVDHISVTSSITFGVVASTTCTVATMTVNGANAGDTVVATPLPVASGIDTVSTTWSGWVSTANTVSIRACNPTFANTASIAAQTWRADVWQH